MSFNDDGRRVSRRAVLRSAGATTVGLGAVAPVAGRDGDRGNGGSDGLVFGEQTYVDTRRAGGEPTVEMHPDGTLLYGAHAGTTHFYAPEAVDQDSSAFVNNYEGQTYYWYSDDLGENWHFVERTTPPDGVPGSGFSDPAFAIDMAGNVYISEINLVNVAVSKSYDSGRTYQLQNLFGQVMEDRQWMAADEENVLYMTGNSFGGGSFPNDPVGNVGRYLWKSTDGGETFDNVANNSGGFGDMDCDKSTGAIYETVLEDGTLSMGVYRNARQDEFDRDLRTIADGVDLGPGRSSYEVDPESNVHVTWSETGGGDRPAGIYYAVSTDEARTWSDPIRVDADQNTVIWPWLSVGDAGRVALVWLQASEELPNHDPETEGDHVWRVMAAGSEDTVSGRPGFVRAVATPRPVHQGTICGSGTVCQAQGVDRRLGDYFSVAIDNTGRMWIGYPDTFQGGAVALPGFVRQTDGILFREGENEDGRPGRGKAHGR